MFLAEIASMHGIMLNSDMRVYLNNSLLISTDYAARVQSCFLKILYSEKTAVKHEQYKI